MVKYMMEALLCMLVGYTVGCLNPAFTLAKMRGFDIRDRGSGNAGASNAIITMGKGVGLFCALFDILKAYFVVKVMMHVFPLLKVAGIVAGGFCIIGHIFPVTMKFQGGKGLASLGGVILAYNSHFFVILLLIELLAVIIINYICIVPTSASIVFTAYLMVVYGVLQAAAFVPFVLVICNKHKENFKRIHYGLEARFCYLWKKRDELARIQNNWDHMTEEERHLFDKDTLKIEQIDTL